jgi:hypothetical protein
MTAKELIQAFQSELHQRDRGPIADTDDILHFLTKAQENFVKDKFAGNRTSALGFEQSQDVTDDLRVFFEKDCLTQTMYAGSNARWENIEVDWAPLPADYLHLVSARARTQVSDSFTGINRDSFVWDFQEATYEEDTYSKRVANASQSFETKVATLRFSQSDDVFRKLDDPFHTTIHNSPLCDLNNDRLNVYTNSTFITEAIVMNYIRAPKEITLDGVPQTSELPEALHREIVERAVRLFLQFSPRSSQPEGESS